MADYESSDNTSIDETRSLQSRNTLNRCDLKHHSLWSTNVEIRDKTYFVEPPDSQGGSQSGNGAQKQSLQVLSLAHNAFSVVPRSLSCLAPQLTRLNLSFNKLTKMGHLSSFPASLKQLDLSHNQIDSWFMEVASDNICYTDQLEHKNLTRSMSKMSVMSTPKMSKMLTNSQSSTGACPHKKHCRLDNLRTLIVSDNLLDSIKIHHSG